MASQFAFAENISLHYPGIKVNDNRMKSDASLRSDFSKLKLDGNFCLGDIDALPSSRKPAPAQYVHGTLTHSLDPDLCVTPEKSAAIRTSNRIDSQSPSSFRGSRSSLKVRFDDVVNVHQLAVDDVQENGESDSSSEDEIIEVIKYDYIVEEDEDRDLKEYDSSKISPPRSIDVREKIKSNTAKIDIIQSSLPASCYVEHALARPEFNTTLRNVKKIKGVQVSELDVASALKKEIRNSEQTQKQVAEKASAKVDIKDPQQFVDLVGVNVPEEEVISVVAQEMAAQIKPSHKPKSRPEDYITNPPDIMEFFTDDLQKEFPSWTLPGVKLPQPQLCSADPYLAFDIYQHKRAWENE